MPIPAVFHDREPSFDARAAAKAVGSIGEAVFVQRTGDGNAGCHREQGCDNRHPDAAGQQQRHIPADARPMPMPTTGKYFAERDSQSGAMGASDACHGNDGHEPQRVQERAVSVHLRCFRPARR